MPFYFSKLIYDAPWARIGPFIIGIILGYIIFAVKTKTMTSGLTKVCAHNIIKIFIYSINTFI